MAQDPDIIPEGGTSTPAPDKRKPGRPKKAAKADRAPRSEKSGAAKRAEKKAGELALIREAFAEVLAAPAMLAAAKGDQWAVDHFTKAGPALAERIAVECERNEQLRARLAKMASGSGYVMLGTAIGAYLLPPLIHYGLIPGLGLPGMGDIPRQAPSGPQGPRPGEQPPFQQQPRPPADRPPDYAPPPAVDVEPVDFGGGVPLPAVDPLAAELAANENGGAVPPPPVEAV